MCATCSKAPSPLGYVSAHVGAQHKQRILTVVYVHIYHAIDLRHNKQTGRIQNTTLFTFRTGPQRVNDNTTTNTNDNDHNSMLFVLLLSQLIVLL